MKPRIRQPVAAASAVVRLGVRTTRNSWTTCPLRWARFLPVATWSRICSGACTQPMEPLTWMATWTGWLVTSGWGTLLDDLGTEEEARELSSRTGGGAIDR